MDHRATMRQAALAGRDGPQLIVLESELSVVRDTLPRSSDNRSC